MSKKANQAKKRSPKRHWVFPPAWTMPVVERPEFSEETETRQMEYLNALSELTCSNEGNELESLAHLSKQHRDNLRFSEPDFMEAEDNYE